jgi:glycosyltransferase involved in cell wall biosynthesis
MEPILNVFPLSEAPPSPSRQEGDRIESEPSLYWFSQTIGPGRGIEVIIQAMGQMHTPVRLHLRGFLAASYAETLQQLAKEEGVGDRIHFLPSAPPAQMAQLAACHDIGLSLELTQPLNRAICLTNKIFIYLLAGIPILMNRTPAQQEFAGQLEEAAVLIDIHNPEEIAGTLETWLSHPTKLASARAAAWKLGRERYNWDVEQTQFLSILEKSLR